MKTIKTATLTILMTCAAVPAWGMDDNLSVIPYSTATPEQQQVAIKIMQSYRFLQGADYALINANADSTKDIFKDILLFGDTAKGAILYKNLEEKGKKMRRIIALAIDAASKRQGYGRYLMEKNQDDAQKLAIQTIWLQPADTATVNFYKKMGFQFNESRIHPIMYKDLQSSSESSSQGSL